MNEKNIIDASLVDESDPRCADFEKIEDLFSICTPTQTAVLGLLAQSQSTGIDPTPFLDALANELPKSDRNCVLEMATHFRENNSLIDTVESSAGFFPSPVVLAFRLANDSGKLGKLCRSIANRPIYVPVAGSPIEQTPFGRFAWAIWQGCFMLFVMTFIMLFIIPQFEEMFSEFGIELPSVTIWLIKFATFVCQWGLVLFALLAGFAVWHLVRSYEIILRRFSSLRWRQQEHAPAVQTKLNLAWLSDSGLGFAEGLSHLSHSEPNRRMAAKIKQAKTRTEDGQAPWKALAITGVLSDKESLAIETASSPETRSWLLRQMAFAQAQRFRSWSATRIRLYTSLINIAFGLLVLLFCVGLFAPLIHIIRGLSG